MDKTALTLLLIATCLAVQMTSVEGVCFWYVCKRRCRYRAPRFEEYAFRYLWPRACGYIATRYFGVKACCVTYGRY